MHIHSTRVAWRRIAFWTLSGIAGLLLAALAGLLLWVWASLPPLDGTDRLTGLDTEVDVERDARGRVTVRASSREDMAFGLGYAHGQDRFFQMDLLRRAGSGTLAALIGPAGLRLDEWARRHDLAGTARAALRREPASKQAILDAYARGVSAGLASLRARPWEYILLRQTPEPWRALDTYHVILAMFRDLQDESNARERALDLASRALNPSVFALLTASPGPWEAPIEGHAGPWPQARIPKTGPGRTRAPAPIKMKDGPLLDPDTAMVGSNAFAVGGALTSDGRAMLANDMHLALRVPTTWYPVRLARAGAEPLDAVGVTLPGAPALVVGSNGRIAWGLTNSYGDWLDHVVIERDPKDPERYRTPQGWRRFEHRQERIEIAGEDPVSFEITHTIWGPVVGSDTDGRPLALRWVAQEPEALNLRLLDLVEQQSVKQALDLAPEIGVPAQNVIVAGADGSVGWTLMGRIPRRVGLDGPRPRIWADGDVGWLGWLSADAVPRIGPQRTARLWTANARVVDLNAQRILGDGGYDLGARARRIRERLFAREDFDESALFAIQLDTRAELMGMWHGRLRALIERHPKRASLLALLDDWTGAASTDSVAYRLVHDWRAEVTRTLLDALGAPVRAMGDPDGVTRLPRTEVAVWAILRTEPEWVPAGYSNWSDLELACLDRVLAGWGDPSQWSSRTWGERNTTAIAHPFSAALPGWLRSFLDLPARQVPGDANLPRVAAPSFGASERLVVAPGAESEGILHLPGGVNAHPFSSLRLGDYEDWAAGDPVSLLPGPAVRTRRLLPLSPPTHAIRHSR